MTSTQTEQSRAAFAAVRAEVAKAVVGQDPVVSGLIVALLADGHVLLEGVPGVAKTLLVRSLAAALSLETKRVQFTPDLMPGDVTGSLIYDSRSAEFEFRQGPVFTNLLLADEINRTPPKTQAALLEAMEERQVSVDGTPRPLPDPFMVIATQNPVEYEGTYPLPEAQLDLRSARPRRRWFIGGCGPGRHRRRPRCGSVGVDRARGARVHRRRMPRHPQFALGLPRRISAWCDCLDAHVASVGMGVGSRLRDTGRRESPCPPDIAAPAGPATGGRTRRRDHRCGARGRARHGARTAMRRTWQ